MTVTSNLYYQKKDESCVQYGLSPKALTSKNCTLKNTIYGTSRTWFYRVDLAGLKPATKYYYKIDSTNSSVDFFLSPRAPGDRTPFAVNAVIDLGVYGDNGFTIEMDHTKRDMIPQVQPSLNHTTIGRLATTTDDYEFIVHPGDLGYADDWYLRTKNVLNGKDAYQAILEMFYEQLAPIAGRKMYMTGPSNHEAVCAEIPELNKLCPAGQRDFMDFQTRFENSFPRNFPSSSKSDQAKANAEKARGLAFPPLWYSFEYGMVHFTMIDTETDFDHAPDQSDGSANLGAGPFGSNGQQLEFLEADLASVDRTVTPWVVVAGHRTFYSTGKAGCEACRTAFEPILYKYGVDLGIFGHVHNSQRFQPLYDYKVDPNGLKDPKAPLYIVAGGAGNIEGLSKVGERPDYTAWAYDEHFAYATVSFVSENSLQIDFIRSSSGEKIDTAVLYKSHKEQFVVQS